MNKPVVKASELIKNSGDKVLHDEERVLLDYLVKLKDSFNLVENKENKVMLSVEIDTGNDFLLNSKSFLSDKIFSEKTESFCDEFYRVFLNFFSNLSVSVSENKKSEYGCLRDMVFSSDFKKEFLLLDKDFAEIKCISGNCKLNIKVLPFNKLDLEFMVIELD